LCECGLLDLFSLVTEGGRECCFRDLPDELSQLQIERFLWNLLFVASSQDERMEGKTFAILPLLARLLEGRLLTWSIGAVLRRLVTVSRANWPNLVETGELQQLTFLTPVFCGLDDDVK
jgi:hypothetical protein